MYKKVKRLYDLGLYTAEQVKDFADRGKITPEQYISTHTLTVRGNHRREV